MDETKGRVPVYAVPAHHNRETVMLTQIAEKCGVDAVSIPYNTDVCYTFTGPAHQALPHCRTEYGSSVLLYNNPPKTSVSLAPASSSNTAEVPNIVGYQRLSGDMTN